MFYYELFNKDARAQRAEAKKVEDRWTVFWFLVSCGLLYAFVRIGGAGLLVLSLIMKGK